MGRLPTSGTPLIYKDTGELRRQDDVDLATFVSLRDRAKLLSGDGAPFFSGREAEINLFLEMLDDVGRGVLADSTYIVEGPPGAGKTALMAQCVCEAAARPATREGRSWLPVVVHSSITNSAQALGKEIDRAIAGHLASPAGKVRRKRLLVEIEDLSRDTDATEESAAQDALSFVKEAGGELAKTSPSQHAAIFDRIAGRASALLQTAGAGRAATIVKKILNRGVSFTGFAIGPSRDAPNPTIADVVEDRQGAWDAYQIVLFVDEGQNIPPTSPTDVSRQSVLSLIHEGRAHAQLSLCVFGLAGTWKALSDVGISRTVAERDIQLGELSESGCAMAARRCFRQFRVANGEDWERAIVSRAQGWPQHLAGYLVAAMKELGKHGRINGGRDAELADFEAAIAAGDRTREEYYRQRARSLGRSRHVELAAHVAAALRASTDLSASEVERVLVKEDNAMAKEEERREFLSAAFRSGFLSYDHVEQRILMPIPSFAGFLLREAPEPVPNLRVCGQKGQ